MALTLDGSVGMGGLVGNPVTVTLSTTKAGDIIYLFSISGTATITGISDVAGLTWHNRIAPFMFNSSVNLESWWAYAPNALTADVISITYNTTPTPRIAAFGINGAASSTAPFDPNVSLPAEHQATGTSNSNTISTNNANCFLISFLRGTNGLGTITEPSGFTLITTTGSSLTDIGYKVVSAAQSSQVFTYNWTTSDTAEFIMDAVYGPSSGTLIRPSLLNGLGGGGFPYNNPLG